MSLSILNGYTPYIIMNVYMITRCIRVLILVQMPSALYKKQKCIVITKFRWKESIKLKSIEIIIKMLY